MKTAAGLLLGAVAVLSAGCAGPSEAMKDTKAMLPGLAQEWTGVVVRADDQRNLLSVRNPDAQGEQEVSFKIAPDTEMKRQQTRINLSELQEGTPVRVSYEAATGSERALEVEVLTGEEAQKVQQRAAQSGQQQ